MRKGGGKSKGNQFERDQARLISLWLSNGEDPDLLWRSSSSGGRASSGKTTAHFGDLGIQKTDSLYTEQAKRFLDIFSVEIKRYKVFH